MSTPASPTSRVRRRRAGICSLAAAAALTLTISTSASAEVTPTVQAVADNGAFLAHVPPPSQRAGMCLVDTGVSVNPDTESTVVYRGAIDGGTGDDVSPDQHGTIMAMMAAAPANGWGMVGTASNAVQIVSIRILEPEQISFPFDAYASGITDCLQLSDRYGIRTINLSLGSSEIPSTESYEAVANAIERANAYGIAVVAAAGNDDGGTVEYPAAYAGVLGVGASDTLGGAVCAFSNRGENLLWAPGCDLDAADPTSGTARYNVWQGSSEASVITAAALTALFAHDPSLSAREGEQDLREADHGTLDIAQTFRAAGLGQLVTEGEAAEPHPQTAHTPEAHTPEPAAVIAAPIGAAQPVAPPPTAAPGPDLLSAFPRPAVKLQRRNGRNVLMLAERPSEARVEVRYLGYRRHSSRLSTLRTRIGTFSALAIPSSAVELSARYIDPYDISRTSPWVTVHAPDMPLKARQG
jgi:Subtilase family